MLRIFICFILAIGPLSSAVRAEVYQPLSPWNIDYGETSCDLKRIFKGESGEIQIQISQAFDLQGGSFYIITQPNGKRPSWFADVNFSIDETGAKMEKNTGFQLNREENILIWQIYRFDLDYLEGLPDNVTLRLNTQKYPEIALRMTGMKAVSDAFRQCQRNLYETFGLDYRETEQLSRQLKPDTSPGGWVNSFDYPDIALRRGYQGKVWFMLNVDKEGKSQKCTILRSSGYPVLDDTTCETLLKRGRFVPALDKDGQPTPSIWTNAVLYSTAR
ncbi:MAG: energy transducer TonB [Parasphingorhabdus sp.]|nr:energy transducer TonB [Parasphingorhabdus sp.]